MRNIGVIISINSLRRLFFLERGASSLKVAKGLMMLSEIILRFLPRPSGKRRSFYGLTKPLVSMRYVDIPLGACHIELVLLLFRFLHVFKSDDVILVFFVHKPFVLLSTFRGFINVWCFVTLRVVFCFGAFRVWHIAFRFICELLRRWTFLHSESRGHLLCILEHLLWSACISCDGHYSS